MSLNINNRFNTFSNITVTENTNLVHYDFLSNGITDHSNYASTVYVNGVSSFSFRDVAYRLGSDAIQIFELLSNKDHVSQILENVKDTLDNDSHIIFFIKNTFFINDEVDYWALLNLGGGFLLDWSIINTANSLKSKNTNIQNSNENRGTIEANGLVTFVYGTYKFVQLIALKVSKNYAYSNLFTQHMLPNIRINLETKKELSPTEIDKKTYSRMLEEAENLTYQSYNIFMIAVETGMLVMNGHFNSTYTITVGSLQLISTYFVNKAYVNRKEDFFSFKVAEVDKVLEFLAQYHNSDITDDNSIYNINIKDKDILFNKIFNDIVSYTHTNLSARRFYQKFKMHDKGQQNDLMEDKKVTDLDIVMGYYDEINIILSSLSVNAIKIADLTYRVEEIAKILKMIDNIEHGYFENNSLISDYKSFIDLGIYQGDSNLNWKVLLAITSGIILEGLESFLNLRFVGMHHTNIETIAKYFGSITAAGVLKEYSYGIFNVYFTHNVRLNVVEKFNNIDIPQEEAKKLFYSLIENTEIASYQMLYLLKDISGILPKLVAMYNHHTNALVDNNDHKYSLAVPLLYSFSIVVLGGFSLYNLHDDYSATKTINKDIKSYPLVEYLDDDLIDKLIEESKEREFLYNTKKTILDLLLNINAVGVNSGGIKTIYQILANDEHNIINNNPVPISNHNDADKVGRDFILATNLNTWLNKYAYRVLSIFDIVKVLNDLTSELDIIESSDQNIEKSEFHYVTISNEIILDYGDFEA